MTGTSDVQRDAKVKVTLRGAVYDALFAEAAERNLQPASLILELLGERYNIAPTHLRYSRKGGAVSQRELRKQVNPYVDAMVTRLTKSPLAPPFQVGKMVGEAIKIARNTQPDTGGQSVLEWARGQVALALKARGYAEDAEEAMTCEVGK